MRFKPSADTATMHASWRICTQYGLRISRAERNRSSPERTANGRTAFAMFFRRFIAPPSYLLGPGLPQDPGGLPQEDGDEEDEDDPVPVGRGQVRRGHRLRLAHDQGPEHRSRDVPDAAEDGGGERLQPGHHSHEGV